MKLTKSILREMIKDVLSEADIMDKEIKNPKTGNKIKVKTALQLPDEHPANKKAKKMLAKSGEVGGPSYPNVPKKKPKEKPKGISMFDPLSGKEYEPRDEPKPELNRDDANEDAVKSAEKIADKYGINNDQSHNDQGLSHTSIGAGGEYDGDNQITVAADEYEDGSIKYGIAVNDEDAMQGPFTFKNFNTKKEMESALDKLLSDKKIQKALKAGTNLRDVKDRVDSIMGTKGEYQDDEEVKGPKPGGDWDNEQVMNATIGGEKVSDIFNDEEHPDYDKALSYIMSFDPDDEKVVSGGGSKKESITSKLKKEFKQYDNINKNLTRG
jgi:hypothetical protein